MNACKAFGKRILHDAVAAYAGESTLFIIISFFPFIMFLLTLFRYLPLTESDLTTFIGDNIPSMFAAPFLTVVNEIYNKSGGTIMSITIITTIWSASRGMLTIVRGLNSVYHIDENRNYFVVRGLAMLYTLGFALVLILTLGLLVFGTPIIHAIMSRMPDLLTDFLTLINFRQLITIVVLILFFLLLFKYVPSRKGKLIYGLPGAVLTAVGWTLFSFAYAFYIENFGNYTYMYGSLTAVVLFVLWMYFCFYMLFIGAEFNALIEEQLNHKYTL